MRKGKYLREQAFGRGDDMNKALLTTAFVVVCSMLSVFAQETDMGLSAGSAYIFRGITEEDAIVLQPKIETRMGLFGFKVWGNSNLEEWDQIDDQGVFSDLDVSFFLGVKDDIIDWQAGYTEYAKSTGVSPETMELYACVAWFATQNLQPRTALYYDIAEYEDFYANIGLGYVSFLGSSMEITAKGLIGYMGNDMSLGEKGGFNEYLLGVDMLYHVSDYTRLNIELAYTSSLDDDVLPEQPVDFYFVVGLSRIMM